MKKWLVLYDKSDVTAHIFNLDDMDGEITGAHVASLFDALLCKGRALCAMTIDQAKVVYKRMELGEDVWVGPDFNGDRHVRGACLREIVHLGDNDDWEEDY